MVGGKTTAITEADLAALNAQTHKTLARWACLLNDWQWPEELPDPEPPPSRAKPWTPKAPRRTAVIQWIKDLVGEKAVSEEWNCRYRDFDGRMTVDEHERWWNADEAGKWELVKERRRKREGAPQNLRA